MINKERGEGGARESNRVSKRKERRGIAKAREGEERRKMEAEERRERGEALERARVSKREWRGGG